MTSLVRRYLETAIAFLGVGRTLGGWMMVRRELVGAYPSPYVVSAHTHAILVGFVMLMILGAPVVRTPTPSGPHVHPHAPRPILRPAPPVPRATTRRHPRSPFPGNA